MGCAKPIGEILLGEVLHYDAKLASMNHGTIGGCERQPITAKNSEKQRGWPLFYIGAVVPEIESFCERERAAR